MFWGRSLRLGLLLSFNTRRKHQELEALKELLWRRIATLETRSLQISLEGTTSTDSVTSAWRFGGGASLTLTVVLFSLDFSYKALVERGVTKSILQEVWGGGDIVKNKAVCVCVCESVWVELTLFSHHHLFLHLFVLCKLLGREAGEHASTDAQTHVILTFHSASHDGGKWAVSFCRASETQQDRRLVVLLLSNIFIIA